MPSSFLGLSGDRRSRSKSPGPRRQRGEDYYPEDDRYRRQSARYSGADYNEAPLYAYEERTPDAYDSGPTVDDRRPSRRGEYNEDGRKYSRTQPQYIDYSPDEQRKRPTPARKERDVHIDYPDSPMVLKSPRSSYVNGVPWPDATRAPAAPSSKPSSPRRDAEPAPPPQPPRPKPGQYAEVGKFEYATPTASEIQYNYSDTGRQPSYSKYYDTVEAAPPKPPRSSKSSIAAQGKSYTDDKYQRKPSVRPDPARADSNESARARPRQVPSPRRESYTRERSPNPAVPNAEQLRKSLGRLSTSGAASLAVGGTPQTPGAKPPGSPLLESYKGTYQTISPLPSPLALAVLKDDDISDLEMDDDDDELAQKMRALKREKQRIQQLKKLPTQDLISPRSSGSRVDVVPRSARTSIVSTGSSSTPKTGKSKGVTFYDPQSDAEKIAEGLKGSHRSPDVKPLLKIMPWLTTDEIIHLKQSYKNYARVGGQGINLSKHIKARLSGNLCKIIYATSLGRYESDAYWANCFYQSGASRRELLIESLVGRSNQQIREIKDVFKDKRYDDDLEKCMKAELKADKFRTAILLCLEERRMPEGIGVDMKRVHEDGMELYTALNNPGGETAMLQIILTRSNDHLKEVLRYYEKSYGKNFAREMIRKSQNLVVSHPGRTAHVCHLANRTQGETLAHILNGALNRPMRDAILLHQAIEEFAPTASNPRTPNPTKEKAPGRAELLISRVVRLHWEPKHLEKVKSEYEKRYRESVTKAMIRDVQGPMKTDDGRMWAGFAVDLIRSSEP